MVSSRLLRADLAQPASLFEFAVARGVDLGLTVGLHVLRSNEADRAVQTHGVVVIDVALGQAPRILQRQRRSRTDAFRLQGLVPARRAEVRFSGLAPGLVGVWQINALIPTDAATGSAVPLSVDLGLRSNTLSVAIQ